jgi:hypothetical protein
LKRITTFILIALVAACARATTGADNQLTGAPAPRLAVEQFLNAVRAQDLQAMSVIFGTSKGPARDLIERGELEKRLIIMQCFFNNDKFRILSENIQGGRHNFQIELTRGTRVRQTSAQTVKGPSERWYVESLDIAAVRDFCAEQSPS